MEPGFGLAGQFQGDLFLGDVEASSDNVEGRVRKRRGRDRGRGRQRLRKSERVRLRQQLQRQQTELPRGRYLLLSSFEIQGSGAGILILVEVQLLRLYAPIHVNTGMPQASLLPTTSLEDLETSAMLFLQQELLKSPCKHP